jgi:hypothetical protein
MKNIITKRIFTITSGVVAIIFWFFESAMHYFVHEEPQFEIIPSASNELWMRIVIVFLITLFGILSDSFTNKIIHKQMEVARTYNSMLHVSQHIMNNLLNQMELFKLEALKQEGFDQDVLKLYDNSINEASDLIKTLSKVEDISEGHIWASGDMEKN